MAPILGVRGLSIRAAEAHGEHLGRLAIPKRVESEIEALADLSIRQIQARVASRGVVGEITDHVLVGPLVRIFARIVQHSLFMLGAVSRVGFQIGYVASPELSVRAEIVKGAVEMFAAFKFWLNGWSTSSDG